MVQFDSSTWTNERALTLEHHVYDSQIRITVSFTCTSGCQKMLGSSLKSSASRSTPSSEIKYKENASRFGLVKYNTKVGDIINFLDVEDCLYNRVLPLSD